MIQVTVEELEKVIIMHLDGNLFLAGLNNVISTWEEIVQKKPGVIAIDCSRLSSIDSTAIGTLVKFFNEAMSKQIELVFYDLNPAIRKLFYTIHLERFFSVTTGKHFYEEYINSNENTLSKKQNLKQAIPAEN